MGKFEHKNNSGSIFKNKKRDSDKHPNLRGDGKIDGTEYWISAWTRKDKNGDPWFSLSFEPKESKPKPPEPTAQELGISEEDLPF